MPSFREIAHAEAGGGMVVVARVGVVLWLGGVAMGLPHVRVDEIEVLQDSVVLAMIATDKDDDIEAPDNARDQ